MEWTKSKILQVLDECAGNFTFPVLDNGYLYLASTRMTVYISDVDWAIVIEVFGFSPRSETPDTQIYTFASKLYNRNPPSNYISTEAYDNYLTNNPFNESRFIFPIDNNEWQNSDNHEYIKDNGICILRGKDIPLPAIDKYKEHGISLEEDSPMTFEFCRYLADQYNNKVLANNEEKRLSVLPEMKRLLELDKWFHPDISGEEKPSDCVTFNQIAEVILNRNPKLYKPSNNPNTHWENWPESGTL